MADTPLHIPELGDKFVDYRDPVWGDSYNWSWNRPITQVQYLVIHHSVTAHDATPDDIALLHKARGWGGIGYHFVITKDGTVYYVGDIGTARANVLNMNEKVIGVVMIGDFTKHLPSDEQITSAHKLCKFFIDASSIPIKSWDDVVGHKELTATQCPGDSWDKAQQGDMWWRIKTGTVYTPPPTQSEDVYKVTYKGEVLSTYDYNPDDKLKELNKKLASKTTEVSDLTAEVAEIQRNLVDQEQDNADLLTELRACNKKRDDLTVENNLLTRQVTALEDEVKEIKELLEKKDPTKGFSTWEKFKWIVERR